MPVRSIGLDSLFSLFVTIDVNVMQTHQPNGLTFGPRKCYQNPNKNRYVSAAQWKLFDILSDFLNKTKPTNILALIRRARSIEITQTSEGMFICHIVISKRSCQSRLNDFCHLLIEFDLLVFVYRLQKYEHEIFTVWTPWSISNIFMSSYWFNRRKHLSSFV